jgi:hypothetical protein
MRIVYSDTGGRAREKGALDGQALDNPSRMANIWAWGARPQNPPWSTVVIEIGILKLSQARRVEERIARIVAGPE